MLRFPLQLTADLTLARLAHKLRLVRGVPPVQFVDVAAILHPDDSHPVSHEKMREIISSRSPVVWIGGSEPLRHPGIAHLVRAITQTGHFVFLDTDGTFLRRRIHEFQPVSRLFLTVRLEPAARRPTPKSLRANASELAVEGIRAARLSGFLTCVHAPVHVENDLGEIAELIQLARSLDVDGMVITPANGEADSANADAAALQRKTADARKLMESKWWASFSRLIDSVVSGERQAPRSAADTGVRLEQVANANGEGIKVA